MNPQDRPSGRNAKTWSVVRVSSGNFLEMYDFMVFGYYASAIGRAFFPNGNPFVSLMLSLMTFGAGFLLRPMGAWTRTRFCFSANELRSRSKTPEPEEADKWS
jgi:hypothetical protein